MKFDSITLRRIGELSYQVTIWSDGITRWDSDSALRTGAWQSHVGDDWLTAIVSNIKELPTGHEGEGSNGSLVLETSERPVTFPLSRHARPLEAWRLGMVIDGICSHLSWAPLDVSGEHDFTPWAEGCWVSLSQGTSRGQALARKEGILLLAGSTASTATAPTLEDTYKQRRITLLEDGGLVFVGGVLVLTRHLLFTSPSAPASVLAGSNTNGRRAWRDAAGVKWSELQFDH